MQQAATKAREGWYTAAAKEMAERAAKDGGQFGKQHKKMMLTAWRRVPTGAAGTGKAEIMVVGEPKDGNDIVELTRIGEAAMREAAGEADMEEEWEATHGAGEEARAKGDWWG